MDEMVLKANLYYNISLDKVVGFEDSGEIKSLLPACNVAALMFKGVFNNWKQPLAYFLMNSSFSAHQIKNIIIKTITKLQEIGYVVIAFITDMGGNFMQAAKMLEITTDSPYFTVKEQQIAYFIDPPHAIKATRNNFYKHNIIYNDKLISWKFIEQFYEKDQKNQMRLAPKLTESHITPTNFERMQVRYATQILSATVAAGLQKLVVSGCIPNDAFVTADFVREMNNLFDIFNSSAVVHAAKYKKAFIGESFQVEFLLKMKEYLNNLRIVTKQGVDITNKVKVFKYWCQNINSLLAMWDYLHIIAPEIKFLLMRRFTQDALENFFGKIRGLNGNAVNPTPIQFYYSFKKLFSINHCTLKAGNCEQDND